MRHGITYFTPIIGYFTRDNPPMTPDRPKMAIKLEIEVPDDETQWDIRMVDLAIDRTVRRFLQDLNRKRKT